MVMGQERGAVPIGDTLNQRCGAAPAVSTAADRACAQAALPVLVAELDAASRTPAGSDAFERSFRRYNEAVLRAAGPQGDAAALFNQALGPRASNTAIVTPSSSAQERRRAQRNAKRANATIGTCTLAVGVTRTSGNVPTGVSSSQCTAGGAVGIATSDIYVQLNRYSGGYYVVAAKRLLVPGAYAQAIAPDPRNTCGRYFASGSVRWFPKPGYTVNPPYTAGSSREAVYC